MGEWGPGGGGSARPPPPEGFPQGEGPSPNSDSPPPPGVQDPLLGGQCWGLQNSALREFYEVFPKCSINPSLAGDRQGPRDLKNPWRRPSLGRERLRRGSCFPQSQCVAAPLWRREAGHTCHPAARVTPAAARVVPRDSRQPPRAAVALWAVGALPVPRPTNCPGAGVAGTGVGRKRGGVFQLMVHCLTLACPSLRTSTPPLKMHCIQFSLEEPR